jgi:tRNA pseudouridine38-40 synthase
VTGNVPPVAETALHARSSVTGPVAAKRRTVCLTIAYEGTRFGGWQSQPGGQSIQQHLERALSLVTGETIRVAAAGRTDAGVHAIGQLVSFNTLSTIPPRGFCHVLVPHLPPEIVVRDAVERPFGFHARFDCTRKRYRYVIHRSAVPWPWLRNLAWWYRGPLNEVAMHEAAAMLVGTHDFRSFETNWPNRSSSIRTVFAARWIATPYWQPWLLQPQTSEPGPTEPAPLHGTAVVAPPQPQPGPVSTLRHDRPQESEHYLIFEICADGFLYNMVRSIVGTLVHIGRGRWTAADVGRILQAGDRRLAGDTAPAHGLYLVDVDTVVDEARIAERVRLKQLDRWPHQANEVPAAAVAEPGATPPLLDGEDPLE